ncbi:BglG family transcription antiterminator [Salibacterium aidingense]|uniref:BglG family transcription antiterminator n=1 Tax=Salibacterium aidingense TaxID=384933 RepID=UPI003BDBCF20
MTIDYITARERELLRYLLKQEDDTPVAVAAEALNVSSRTIHRDLKGLEKTVQQFGLELKKSTGKGVKIQGPEGKKQDLELTLLQPSVVEYSGAERRTLILCKLLERTEPIKLNTLAVELKVTTATISYDLDRLEEWFTTIDLRLDRRRGFGVIVQGSESAKRAAISSLIAENFAEADLFRVMRENIKNKASSTDSGTISERLLGLVEKDKWLTVEKILADMREELPYHFADSAYIGLVVHLTLAIERISQGENIEINETYLETLKDTKEYEMAQALIWRLEKVFQLKIPEAEIGYITMHLRGAKIREDQDHLPALDHLSSAVHAKALIAYMQNATGEPLKEDPSLYQGLVAHLDPALYRIQENMRIHNPLLEEIKKDYHELFLLVKKAAENALPELKLPESEIGYLALHFGSALEKIQHHRKVNALVVCSSGIGSSKMLVTRLRKEVPEIKELKNISMMDLEENKDQYDVVISTLELSSEDFPNIVVNPFLTHQDVDKVRFFIKQLAGKKNPSPAEDSTGTSSRDSIQVLNGIQRYSGIIVTLLERFQVLPLAEDADAYQVLRSAGIQIKKAGLLNDAEAAAQGLWTRYERGGVALPKSRLALFHSRTKEVKSPCFYIQPLARSIPLLAMDSTSTDVEHFLILLAPEEDPAETYEVLSAISEQLIADDEAIEVFASADEKRIKAHMGSAFREWLKEKL